MFEGSNTVLTLEGCKNSLATQFNTTYIPDYNKIPTVGYFGVGVDGIRDSSDITIPKNPSNLNTRLFQQIPIYMIEVDNENLNNDFDDYRLRTIIEINGVKYYAFWLKKIKVTSINSMIYDRAAGNRENYTSATDISIDVANDTANLIDPLQSSTYINNQNVVLSSLELSCSISGAELQNSIWIYLNSINTQDVKFDFKISELGLFTGNDIEINSGNDSYTDVDPVSVKLAMHKCFHGVDVSSKLDNFTDNITIDQSGNILTTHSN